MPTVIKVAGVLESDTSLSALGYLETTPLPHIASLSLPLEMQSLASKKAETIIATDFDSTLKGQHYIPWNWVGHKIYLISEQYLVNRSNRICAENSLKKLEAVALELTAAETAFTQKTHHFNTVEAKLNHKQSNELSLSSKEIIAQKAALEKLESKLSVFGSDGSHAMLNALQPVIHKSYTKITESLTLLQTLAPDLLKLPFDSKVKPEYEKVLLQKDAYFDIFKVNEKLVAINSEYEIAKINYENAINQNAPENALMAAKQLFVTAAQQQETAKMLSESLNKYPTTAELPLETLHKMAMLREQYHAGQSLLEKANLESKKVLIELDALKKEAVVAKAEIEQAKNVVHEKRVDLETAKIVHTHFKAVVDGIDGIGSSHGEVDTPVIVPHEVITQHITEPV